MNKLRLVSILTIIAVGVVALVYFTDTWVNYPAQTFLISDQFKKQDRQGSATGVWVDKYHVLTNCHVVSMAFEGGRYGAIPFTHPVDTEETVAQEAPATQGWTGETYAISPDGKTAFLMDKAVCAEGADLGLLTSVLPNENVTDIVRFNTNPTFFEKVFSAGYGYGASLSPKVGYIGKLEETFGGLILNVTLEAVPGDSGSPIWNKSGELTGLLSRAMFMGQIATGQRVLLGEKLGIVPASEIVKFLKEQGVI